MPTSQTTTLNLTPLALAMDEDRIALLLTLADEPGLLLAPGEAAPELDPTELAAARLANAWAIAERLNAMDAQAVGATLRAAHFTFDEAMIALEGSEALQ